MLIKKLSISLITASLLTINSYAISSTIGYQGVAINNGTTVSSSTISLKFTILASDDSTIYEETVSGVTTNDKGFFSHNIGSGTAIGTPWADITWSDDYKLKVAIDLANGSSYTDLGSKDLVSVAYTKKAESSDIASALASNPTACTSGQYVTDIAADGTLTCSTPIDTDTKVTVNNSLTSTSTTEALSAAQGKALNDGKLSTTGTAASATKLATARTIGGVSFDGSANIDLPGVNTSGNQNTTGNAATATKLATARTINGVNFDGSANITVADDTKLPLSGGTMTGDMIMSNKYITRADASNDKFGYNSDGDLSAYVNGNNLIYLSETYNATYFNWAQIDQDFVVRTANYQNMIRVDAANNKIGIGMLTPNETISMYINNGLYDNLIQFTNYSTGTAATDGFVVGLNSAEQGEIWHREAEQILFGTSDTERMRIDENGKVGIGTSTPTSTLHVSGSGSQTLIIDTTSTSAVDSTLSLSGARTLSGGNVGIVEFKNDVGSSNGEYSVASILGRTDSADADGTPADGALQFQVGTDGTLSTAMTIKSNGVIGIGTTTPATKLDINGTAQASQFQLDSNAYMTLKTLTNPNFVLNFDANDYLSFDRTTNDMKVNINGEKLRVTSAGNLGIGTSSPTAKLDVRGSAVFNEGSADVDFRVESNGNANMLFVDGGNNRVGIGTSSPSVPLEVKGDILLNSGSTDGANLTLASSGQDNWYIDNYINGELRFINGTNTRMQISSIGNVGIGENPASSGSWKMLVNGAIKSTNSIALNTAAANNYFNLNNANINYNSAGASYSTSFYGVGDIIGLTIRAFSDKRIKTDIKPISNAIETIKQIKPSSYTKIDKVKSGDKTHYGFIAQELEKIIPEAVSKGEGEVPVLKKFDEVSFEDGVEYTILVKNGENIKQETYTTAQTKPQGEVFVLNKKVDDFRTVDYDMVFTHAVAALQEQQQIIETQNKKIDDLTNKLEAIESLLKKNGLVK